MNTDNEILENKLENKTEESFIFNDKLFIINKKNILKKIKLKDQFIKVLIIATKRN